MPICSCLWRNTWWLAINASSETPESMARITNNLFHVIWMCKAMGVIWSRLKLQELSDAFFASSSFSYSVFVCLFVFCILENYGWIFSHFFLEKKCMNFHKPREGKLYLEIKFYWALDHLVHRFLHCLVKILQYFVHKPAMGHNFEGVHLIHLCWHARWDKV